VTKKKLSKLTLRRETLTVLDMKAATGGAVRRVEHRAFCLRALHSYPIHPAPGMAADWRLIAKK